MAILSKKGDEVAIEELFLKYKPLLQKISRGYFLLGSDKEDLLQEANIGLYKAILNFDSLGKTSFKSFAILCIKRNILTAIKKSNTQKNKMLNDSVSFSELNGLEDDDEEYLYLSSSLTNNAVEESEKLQEVQQQIFDKLSSLELQILNQYLKGFSYEIMSQNLHISVKSVDNALSRIKSKLQFLIK